MKTIQILPPIENWGWTSDFRIVWMTIPEAAKALNLLKHCGCKNGCKGRCTCKKIELPCTELCKCSGKCN